MLEHAMFAVLCLVHCSDLCIMCTGMRRALRTSGKAATGKAYIGQSLRMAVHHGAARRASCQLQTACQPGALCCTQKCAHQALCDTACVALVASFRTCTEPALCLQHMADGTTGELLSGKTHLSCP